MTANKPGRRRAPKMSMAVVPVVEATDEQLRQAAHAYDLLVKSIYRRLQHATTQSLVRTVDSEHPKR